MKGARGSEESWELRAEAQGSALREQEAGSQDKKAEN